MLEVGNTIKYCFMKKMIRLILVVMTLTVVMVRRGGRGGGYR